MAESQTIPTLLDDNEGQINKQTREFSIFLSKLLDIDTKQINIALCLGDVIKKLDTLSGTNIQVKRNDIVASDVERSGTTVTEDNGDIQERMLKSISDLEERQTRILFLLETMNISFVHDNEKVLNQVRQVNENQVELMKDVEDVRDKWSLLKANIFGISFLVVGTSAFIVLTTMIIARKINKLNLYYRMSISSIVTDILKRNKASVSTSEIVNKLRDILVTPVENLKLDAANGS